MELVNEVIIVFAVIIFICTVCFCWNICWRFGDSNTIPTYIPSRDPIKTVKTNSFKRVSDAGAEKQLADYSHSAAEVPKQAEALDKPKQDPNPNPIKPDQDLERQNLYFGSKHDEKVAPSNSGHIPDIYNHGHNLNVQNQGYNANMPHQPVVFCDMPNYGHNLNAPHPYNPEMAKHGYNPEMFNYGHNLNTPNQGYHANMPQPASCPDAPNHTPNPEVNFYPPLENARYPAQTAIEGFSRYRIPTATFERLDSSTV